MKTYLVLYANIAWEVREQHFQKSLFKPQQDLLILQKSTTLSFDDSFSFFRTFQRRSFTTDEEHVGVGVIERAERILLQLKMIEQGLLNMESNFIRTERDIFPLPIILPWMSFVTECIKEVCVDSNAFFPTCHLSFISRKCAISLAWRYSSKPIMIIYLQKKKNLKNIDQYKIKMFKQLLSYQSWTQ